MHSERIRYLESPELFTEEHIAHFDLGCGTLTERLLSSLLRENVLSLSDVNGYTDVDEDESSIDDDMDAKKARNDNTAGTVAEPTFHPPERIVNFEERLKRELRYAGLLVEDDVSTILL